MTRRAAWLLPLALAACAGSGLRAPLDGAPAGRRGAVEVAVKSAHPAILAEIAAGGGPAIQAAMDAAAVPPADRPARLIQLRGDLPLYGQNPGALVAALMLYAA